WQNVTRLFSDFLQIIIFWIIHLQFSCFLKKISIMDRSRAGDCPRVWAGRPRVPASFPACGRADLACRLVAPRVAASTSIADYLPRVWASQPRVPTVFPACGRTNSRTGDLSPPNFFRDSSD